MLLRRCTTLLVVSLVACSTTSSSTGVQSPADGGSTSSCTEIASAARSEVSGVIDDHQDCQNDTDCVAIALSVSDCFDSCTRVVAASGQADVEAAKTKVAGAQCANFKAKGCTFEVPPCAPPGPVHCVQTKCTM